MAVVGYRPRGDLIALKLEYPVGGANQEGIVVERKVVESRGNDLIAVVGEEWGDGPIGIKPLEIRVDRDGDQIAIEFYDAINAIRNVPNLDPISWIPRYDRAKPREINGVGYFIIEAWLPATDSLVGRELIHDGFPDRVIIFLELEITRIVSGSGPKAIIGIDENLGWLSGIGRGFGPRKSDPRSSFRGIDVLIDREVDSAPPVLRRGMPVAAPFKGHSGEVGSVDLPYSRGGQRGYPSKNRQH